MLPTVQRFTQWYCPNCKFTDVTSDPRPHSRFHICPGLGGLTAPMVEVGSQARVFAKEREDYVGKERVQTDVNGRPVSAVITMRPDGSNDVTVLAPLARGSR